MSRSLFFVKDKVSGTWCYSSKHKGFCDSFDSASVFLNRENAEKAVKDMNKGLLPKHSSSPTWRLNDDYMTGTEEGYQYCIGVGNRYPDYVVPQLLIPDFEVVEFELVQK